MDDQSSISTNDLVKERDTSLPKILSSLSNETGNIKILENIKICMGYISTFTISQVDEKLLQWIMPVLQSTLQKAFDDNFLLSDTCDDEFVLNILKQNLELILELIQILKDILEFIVEQSEIPVSDVKNVAVTSIQVISSTFDHCRKSSETYKKNFNADLLEIFKIMQDIHSLYLQIFESCIIVTDNLEDEINVKILSEVLDNLCTVSENLFYLNVKLLTTNWKGYLGIAQKFADVLKNNVDLKRPVMYLTSIICDSFISVKDSESVELSIPQVIKLSGFLVKVVLKLFDIFWDSKQKNLNEIMEFSCAMYSFSPQFLMLNYPLEIIRLIDDAVFAHTKLFVLKLLEDELFPQAILNTTLLSEKHCFGFLNFLNICLEAVIMSEGNKEHILEPLIRQVFYCVKICYEEFFWPDTIFDNLVINIAAVVMTHDRFYEKIEIILLENILQEEIWNYFLAVEVWCLLLRNSNPRFCADTLKNLVNIHDQLNFGVNTYRLENIYLSCFIQRVFRMIPDYLKCQVSQSVPSHVNVWKRIGFRHFPNQMKPVLEDVQFKTLEKLEQMGTANFTYRDFIMLAENLESLSTVNYQEMSMTTTNLENAIENIWELPFTDITNNLFRYFIAIICKITSQFCQAFNNKQLYMILNKLTHLSTDEHFKVHICLALKMFCYVNTNQLGQDGCKIFKLAASILSNLLINSNNVIKQQVLEVLETLAENGKYDIVRDVLTNCSGNTYVQGLISDYLRKNCVKAPFNRTYFKAVGRLKYTHSCCKWKNLKVENNCKRIKLDTCEPKSFPESIINTKENVPQRESDTINSFQHNDMRENKKISEIPNINTSNRQDETNVNKNNFKAKLKEFKYKPLKKEEKPSEGGMDIEDESSVDEVIVRIKGEIKCLIDVLKTDKLSAKNVSDLRILTNQLSSLM